MSLHQSIVEITAIKCLLLGKIKKLPNELVSMIIEFSFQNLYKANKVHRFHFINIRTHIDSSDSRFTSNNDENDHWWFINDDINQTIQLQGVNCLKCGQYQNAHSRLKWEILCKCPDQIDNVMHVERPLYLTNN